MQNLLQFAPRHLTPLSIAGALLFAVPAITADPLVSRLTPPSALFTFGDPAEPYISRFLPDQRFDLQATVQPDAGQTIVDAEFYVDGKLVPGTVTATPATVAGLPANTMAWAFATARPRG
jgi:alkaline phosphatase